MTVQDLFKAAQQLTLADQMRLVSQLMTLIAPKIQNQTISQTLIASVEDHSSVGPHSGSSNLSFNGEDSLEQDFEAIANSLADELQSALKDSIPHLSDYAVSRAGIYEEHP